MPRVSINDCSLYVEQHGDGYPVLLLSGLSGVASYWADQVPSFAKEFSVVLHDHRGTGKSDHSDISYMVERMAADVIALMDRLEIERAHIVGHSTGGAIAQVLGIEHPNRVSALVIAASWPKPDAYFRRLFTLRRDILTNMGTTAYAQTANLMMYPPRWIAEHNEALRLQEAQHVASMAPINVMTSRIDALLAFDRSVDLGRIKAPTLIMGAADDIITPAYFSEALARAIPKAELKMFPAGGHCFSKVLVRDFNNAVQRFLRANTPAGIAA
ncbi:MAG TPA: alpha/beta fold hydrolase [Stellaceae bacterium]|jgi:aminoacrylate hydrolase|nr:alpha/beta fold hydrolase [Stellaceae bacterium]